MGRSQNTHTESKQVRLIKEMIKICVFTLFFCSIAGKHFLIKTKDGGQDYDSWPGSLDPKLEASKAARHVSDEPLKCGQMPPPPPLKPGEPCNDLAVKIWGFVDGKCQKFNIKPCGYKLIGFVSEDECQKGCEGQDYQAAPWQCEQRPYLCPTSPNCIPPRC